MGFINFARNAQIRKTLVAITGAGLSAESQTPRILRNEDGSFSLDITGLKGAVPSVKNFDKLATRWESLKFSGPTAKVGSVEINLLGHEVREENLAGELIYELVSKPSTLEVPSELTLDEKTAYENEMLHHKNEQEEEAYYRDLIVAMFPALDTIRDDTRFAEFISDFDFELDENNKLQVKSTSRNPNVFKAVLTSMRTQLRTSVMAYQNYVSKYFSNMELSNIGSNLHKAVDTVVREFALGTLEMSRKAREEKLNKARTTAREGEGATKYQAKRALGEAIIENQSKNYEADAVARTEKLIQVFKGRDEKFFEKRVKKLADESSTKIDAWNRSKETMIEFMASEYAKDFTEDPRESVLLKGLNDYLKKAGLDLTTPESKDLLAKCKAIMYLQPNPLAAQSEKEA